MTLGGLEVNPRQLLLLPGPMVEKRVQEDLRPLWRLCAQASLRLANARQLVSTIFPVAAVMMSMRFVTMEPVPHAVGMVTE